MGKPLSSRRAPAQELFFCSVQWPPGFVVLLAFELLISLALREEKN